MLSNPAQLAIEFTLPIRLQSEANMREHWRKKAARAKSYRALAKMMVSGFARLPEFPLKVTITRVGKRLLDDDNLCGSGKNVRDGIADAFEVNDRDKRYTWVYEQEIGKEYAARVRIETRQ